MHKQQTLKSNFMIARSHQLINFGLEHTVPDSNIAIFTIINMVATNRIRVKFTNSIFDIDHKLGVMQQSESRSVGICRCVSVSNQFCPSQFPSCFSNSNPACATAILHILRFRFLCFHSIALIIYFYMVSFIFRFSTRRAPSKRKPNIGRAFIESYTNSVRNITIFKGLFRDVEDIRCYLYRIRKLSMVLFIPIMRL